MKPHNILLLVMLLFFSSNVLIGQSSWYIGKFKVKKIDFSLGYETDYVNGMDYNFFVAQMPEAQQAELSQLNFQDGEFYSGICENPSISLGLTLVHPSLPKLEWRNSLSYKPNRVDAVSYYNVSDYSGEYININGTHTEYAIESAAIFKLPVVRSFNLYGGAGINTGITSNNTTCVFTSHDLSVEDISFRNVNEVNDQAMVGQFDDGQGYADCFDTGSQINQRVFLQVGTGFIMFHRLEFGIDLKYGIGYRADFGQTSDRTNLVATNLNLRYILK